jgi:predicted HAD superfamily Cof-like phosphohydrolase
MSQTIREQVGEFHKAFKVKEADKPTVPDDATVRLRMRLIAEEFCEALDAAFATPEGFDQIHAIRQAIGDVINGAPVAVNLEELVDAFGDIDYVVEGARRVFGVDGEPIAAEIQRANMAKVVPGSTVRPDGKIMKPADWTPPDIVGELEKQGWQMPTGHNEPIVIEVERP